MVYVYCYFINSDHEITSFSPSLSRPSSKTASNIAYVASDVSHLFFTEDANRHFLRRNYRVHLLTKRNINETKRSRYVIRARMSMKSQNRSRCLAANPRNCVTINLESDDWRNLISALASPFEVARVQKLRRLRIGVFVWRTFARLKLRSLARNTFVSVRIFPPRCFRGCMPA